MWKLRFFGLALSALLLSACQPRNVSFTLRFASSSTRSASAAIRVRILQGDCTGALVFSTAFDPSSPDSAGTPPRLAPGVYAFEAEARDASCQVIATTCVVQELPLQGDALELTLTDTAPAPACAPGQCMDGICSDDEPDAGTPPTPDAGRDTGVVGPDCTSDAECTGGRCRGGMCCSGCWNGAACVAGDSTATCGSGGDDCAMCTAAESCRANACAGGPPVTLALSPITSYVRVGTSLWSAGENAGSQRGQLESATPNVFSRQDTTIEFLDVAAAQLATCGVAVDGRLYCWGSNAPGLLGIGSSDFGRQEVVPQVVGTQRWTDVAAGNSHFCAIRDDSRLFCWGANTEGRLGVAGGAQLAPAEVMGAGTWRAVSPGDTHTCGIRTDGSLRCWGLADGGKLGVAGATSGPMPLDVGGTDWVAVSAGVEHTCGIRGAPGSRELLCWGTREFGRLGDGMSTGIAETPVSIDDGLDWSEVAAGQFHTCAIAGDRGVYCWGVGSTWGQTGLGDPGDSETPAFVTSGFDRIAVGWTHTCAAGVAAGTLETLRCWGDGRGGLLGTGRTDRESMPAVPTLEPAP